MVRDCDCTISHRVNGDGCRYCQPQEYIDRLTDWINEARDEIAALAKERKDLECRLAATESELNRLRCAMNNEKVASGVLSAFWRRVYGAANFTAFDKQVLTAHMLTALSGIDVFSRCELAETVCPDCGPVSVGPDIFDKDVPISGICPKCGDRLYFAERGSDE